MRLTSILRIARRDAIDIIWSRSYIVLFLAPVLLLALIAFVGAVGTAIIVALQVAEPEAAPLGHNRAAVVLEPGAAPEVRALYDRVVETLKAPVSGTARETRLLRRFVKFLKDARSPDGSVSRDYSTRSSPEAADSANIASQAGAGGADPVKGMPAEKLEADQYRIELVTVTDRPWSEVAARVPETYDAAVLIAPGPDRIPRYRLAYDSKLLYSKVMRRQIEERIQALDQQLREARAVPPPLSLRVVDHPPTRPDLWLTRGLVLLVTVGLGFMYYSVGVQSVAGVLAGERESRTLEVLLSLPLTRREVLYGKLLGLVFTTALPALFWSFAIWVPLYGQLRIWLPYVPMTALLLSGLLAANAVGCAVSASSGTTTQARNRLGMVNMAIFGAGAAAMALPASLWPGGTHPLAAMVGVMTGGPSTWPALFGIVGGLLGVALAALEVGHFFFRRG